MKRKKCLYSWLLVLLLGIGQGLCGQVKLDYYLEVAHQQSPLLQNLQNQEKYADLELKRIRAQFKSPQWFATGNYLVAPFFSNNGRALDITTNPDPKAYGYDVGITNGGLYAAQMNVNLPILSQRRSAPLNKQQELTKLRLANQYELQEAELERLITAEFISAYSLQQQMTYTGEISERLNKQKIFLTRLADQGLIRITDLKLLSMEIKGLDYTLNSLKIQFRQAMLALNSDAGIIDISLVLLGNPEFDLSPAKIPSIFLTQYYLDSLDALNDQSVYESRYLPQIGAFADGGINAIALSNAYRKIGLSAGLNLTWLLGDGKQRKISAGQNQILRLNANNLAEFRGSQIYNNRENNLLLRQEHLDNIQLLASQLEGYQTLLNIYQQELTQGQLSLIDYLNVLRTYADLQQQKFQMEMQLLLVINELNYWNN